MALDDGDALLRDTFGSKACILASELLKDKPDYRVWKVDLRDPALTVIIKLAGPGAEYSSGFERTATIHRLVREQTIIPIPEVFLADESCRDWPWRVFIKEFLPGVEFAEIHDQMAEADLHLAQAQIGDAVAQIHSVRFPGFGEIDPSGKHLCGAFPPGAEARPATTNEPGKPGWQSEPASAGLICLAGRASAPGDSWPTAYLPALESHARRIIRSPRDLDLFLSYLEPRQELFAAATTASLCHEDLHKHNILFRQEPDGWQLATVLDFEKAWAGPRESDLARMDLWNMTGEHFWQAYQARLPIDPGYAMRRALYQLLWCLEVAWDTSEHQATLQSVLRKLDETL